MTECQHPDIWGRGGECRVCGESVLNQDPLSPSLFSQLIGLSGLHRFHRLKADILFIHDDLGIPKETHTHNLASGAGCIEDAADWSNLTRSSDWIRSAIEIPKSAIQKMAQGPGTGKPELDANGEGVVNVFDLAFVPEELQ